MAFFAMCCSSFVTISRSTTGRSILLPLGNTSFEKVRTANLLASRHCFEKPRYVSDLLGCFVMGCLCFVGLGFVGNLLLCGF